MTLITEIELFNVEILLKRSGIFKTEIFLSLESN